MAQSETISTLLYRKCGKCGSLRQIAEFHRDRTKPTGRGTTCRHCKNEYARSWRLANGGYWQEWSETHPEYFLRWQLRHPGYRARVSRRWEAAHPNYRVNRYRKIQDEIGHHSGIQDVYPAYRMLKALQEAETVEIKV